MVNSEKVYQDKKKNPQKNKDLLKLINGAASSV